LNDTLQTSLFGKESDSIFVDTLIAIETNSSLLSFAATLSNEKAWRAMDAAKARRPS
jgi:hypothetical protein